MRPVRSFGLAICLLLLVAGGAVAQQTAGEPGSGYDLSWWTVDSGGATFATGPGYSLAGTAGQPDAGPLSGPGHRLAGGFWLSGPGGPGIYRVYVPIVARSYP